MVSFRIIMKEATIKTIMLNPGYVGVVSDTCIYVTQHHQMRHESHTKVLSKWQIKEE